MVFKFFTLTFSLLLAIFISLKISLFGKRPSLYVVFRSHWNQRGGASASEAGAGRVGLDNGRLLYLASQRATQTPSHVECPCPVKTQGDTIWITYLPIYLSLRFCAVVIVIRGTEGDAKLEQRTQRKAEDSPLPAAPCTTRGVLCIGPAGLLLCSRSITVVRSGDRSASEHPSGPGFLITLTACLPWH